MNEDETIIEVIKKEPCNSHKPKNRELAYGDWHVWAHKQNKKGLKQKKCKICGYYLFKSEM